MRSPERSAPFFQAPHHQSELLEAALTETGVPITLYTLHGTGHGFQNATVDKNAISIFASYLSLAKGK